jgi:tetratricopeptide (TPR) repeat protein
VATTALDREAVDQAVARGSELLKQGKLEEAQKAFRAALLLEGENPRVLALLGLTHFRAGQFEQARPIYEELVERAPTDPSHRLNLGLVYLKLGESDKAIGSLEASRALDPSQGRAVSYLGLAYARAGRYPEAYRSFLLAGQKDLATEIEINLTAAERDNINAQLAQGSAPRTKPPKEPPRKTEFSMSIPLPQENQQVSMPEIVVAPVEEATPPPRVPTSFESSAAIVIDTPPPMSSAEIPIVASDPRSRLGLAIDDLEREAADRKEESGPLEIRAPEMSDSQQFVLAERDAVPAPAEGQSVISRAVEIATPTTAGASPGTRVSWGSTPPIPLSQLATEQLVRPEDGDSVFEVTAGGALVIRVTDRVLARLDGIHVMGGELEFDPASRRSRGRESDDKFNYGGTQLHTISGEGYLISVPGDRKFTAVTLDDDILYLREDIVFAFEATLRWENGNVPGLRGKLPVVQFRGDGAVALRTMAPVVRVKLPAQGVLFVDATRLAGWIGRVIPRAVVPPKHGPMGDVCVECTGEGVVLIDPSGVAPPLVSATSDRSKSPSNISPVKAAPPPPPGAGEASSPAIDLDIVKSADWLSDDDKDESGDET